MAFQLSGKFKRIERGSGKNILKWTSEKQMQFNEDERLIDFTRRATGFVEVDKTMKLSRLYLDSNRDGLLDDGDELLFTDNLGYSKKLYKAKKGKFKATNVVADLSEIMGDDIDLSEEIAEGDHSTGRSIFNMTKKNGSQRGFVYMGYIDKGYRDIICSAGPVTEPLSEWCAEI
jgi:hypothetical protein